MSGSVVLPQPGSELVSVAPDTIRGHANARILGHHVGPMLVSEGHVAAGTMSI